MCLATASWLRTGAKIAAKPRDRPPPGLLPGTRAGSVRGGAEPHRRPPGRGDAAGAPWSAATQSLGGAPPTTAHPPPPPVITLVRRPAHVVLPTRGMLRRPPHTCDRHPPSRWPAVRRTPCAPTRAPPADDRTPAAAICHRVGPPSGVRRAPLTRGARRRPAHTRRRHPSSRWPDVRGASCSPDPRSPRRCADPPHGRGAVRRAPPPSVRTAAARKPLAPRLLPAERRRQRSPPRTAHRALRTAHCAAAGALPPRPG